MEERSARTVRIVHAANVAERFPDNFTGVLRAASDAPLSPRPAALAGLQSRVGAPAGLERARRATQRWSTTFAALGASPRCRSSIGQLLDRLELDGAIALPLALVELYCWYSLACGVPMGGYRSGRLSGDMALCFPGKGRAFTPLGHPHGSPQRTRGREVAVVDDEKVLCRYWNQHDCDETKLVSGLSDVIFWFDFDRTVGDTPEQADEVLAAFAEMLSADVVTARLLVPGGNLVAELPGGSTPLSRAG